MNEPETLEDLERSVEIALILLRGELEIETGVGHDLDDVLAEADAILRPPSPPPPDSPHPAPPGDR